MLQTLISIREQTRAKVKLEETLLTVTSWPQSWTKLGKWNLRKGLSYQPNRMVELRSISVTLAALCCLPCTGLAPGH